MAITIIDSEQVGRGGLSRLDHSASQVVHQRNPCEKQKTAVLKLDKTINEYTWNVRSMYEVILMQYCSQ